MKTKLIAILISSMALTALADIPNTFTSGAPARASEVNENFEGLDQRVSELESSEINEEVEIVNLRVTALENTVEDLATSGVSEDIESLSGRIDDLEGYLNYTNDSPHTLDAYTPKTANIGDIVGVIGDYTYVLGALPFREYRVGVIYKVLLPMKRYECVSSASRLSSSNNSIYIDNYQCANGGQYYYSSSFSISHNASTFNDDMSISGYPASFSQFSGEGSSIGIRSTSSRVSYSSNTDVEPKEHIDENETRTFLRVDSNQTISYLRTLVGDTVLRFSYSPPYYDNQVLHEEDTPANSGPDFSLHLDSTELNDHISLDLLNQYKDLYNYISIEAM